MKSIIALIIGVAIGGGSTAIAATNDYWKESGKTYSCEGSALTVFCKETNWQTGYRTGIFPSLITVAYGRKLIFSCGRKYEPNDNCEYYGR